MSPSACAAVWAGKRILPRWHRPTCRAAAWQVCGLGLRRTDPLLRAARHTAGGGIAGTGNTGHHRSFGTSWRISGNGTTAHAYRRSPRSGLFRSRSRDPRNTESAARPSTSFAISPRTTDSSAAMPPGSSAAISCRMRSLLTRRQSSRRAALLMSSLCLRSRFACARSVASEATAPSTVGRAATQWRLRFRAVALVARVVSIVLCAARQLWPAD
jgi:hypothetical protein